MALAVTATMEVSGRTASFVIADDTTGADLSSYRLDADAATMACSANVSTLTYTLADLVGARAAFVAWLGAARATFRLPTPDRLPAYRLEVTHDGDGGWRWDGDYDGLHVDVTYAPTPPPSKGKGKGRGDVVRAVPAVPKVPGVPDVPGLFTSQPRPAATVSWATFVAFDALFDRIVADVSSRSADVLAGG